MRDGSWVEGEFVHGEIEVGRRSLPPPRACLGVCAHALWRRSSCCLHSTWWCSVSSSSSCSPGAGPAPAARHCLQAARARPGGPPLSDGGRGCTRWLPLQGQGRKRTSQGHAYEGGFQRGEMQGAGRMVLACGDSYQGGFSRNCFSGGQPPPGSWLAGWLAGWLAAPRGTRATFRHDGPCTPAPLPAGARWFSPWGVRSRLSGAAGGDARGWPWRWPQWDMGRTHACMPHGATASTWWRRRGRVHACVRRRVPGPFQRGAVQRAGLDGVQQRGQVGGPGARRSGQSCAGRCGACSAGGGACLRGPRSLLQGARGARPAAGPLRLGRALRPHAVACRRYQGGWLSGRRHGKGLLRRSNGDTYEVSAS
jgi:hypothetical protein